MKVKGTTMIELPKSGTIILSRRFALLPPLMIAVSLAACGGGGSGTDSPSAAPTAIPGAVQTSENIPVDGTLSATDPDGDTLSFSIVSQGSLGTARIVDAVNGVFTYMPGPDTVGTDSFTFKANDGSFDSNAATVAVTILGGNQPPVAQDGSLVTTEDTPATGTLLATDPERQSLTYSIVSNGSQGTASITDASSGAFIYVPDTDASGSDTFTFKANDVLADSNVATVTVDIIPVNDPPTATGSCSTTRQTQILSGTLRATDPESPGMLTYTLEDGSTGPFTTANGGEVSITNTTTGAFVYTPRSGAGGGRGRDSFVYRVSDPDGSVGSATETVVVDQRVMPLGDSITAGRISLAEGPPESLRGGYRKPLQDRLVASGFKFDFVGSMIHGYDLPDFDYNHEGHGGYTAAEIAVGLNPGEGVYNWLTANPADFVLLHIGTNGLDRNNYLDVRTILDEIDRWEASPAGNPVTVILGLIIDQLIPPDYTQTNPEVTIYNNNVLTMANQRIANGDDIVIVDHQTALTYPNDMGDDIHPGPTAANPTGYSKMAAVWFNKLSTVLDKCP